MDVRVFAAATSPFTASGRSDRFLGFCDASRVRKPVELRHAYRLLNHGPTTLVTSAAGGRRNVMAAAWVMAIDFDPPKIAAVIDAKTHTRELVDAAGEFGLSLPTAALADATWTVGKVSGRDIDKFAAYALPTFAAEKITAPMIEGCAAWLECRVIAEPSIAATYDLLVAEVVAAYAEDTLFANGAWTFGGPETRTLHHLARGTFFRTGERLDATELAKK